LGNQWLDHLLSKDNGLSGFFYHALF
jgi:hypothetical protein